MQRYDIYQKLSDLLLDTDADYEQITNIVDFVLDNFNVKGV